MASRLTYLAELGKPLELQIFDNGEPIDLTPFTVTNRHPQFATFANGVVTPVLPGSTTLVFESADAKFEVNVLVADPKKLVAQQAHNFTGQKTEHAGAAPTRGVDLSGVATIEVTPGSTQVMVLNAKNLGSDIDTLVFVADVPAGYSVQFFRDANANGQLDALEQTNDGIGSSGLAFAADQIIPILLSVTAPQNAVAGDQFTVRAHSKNNVSAVKEMVITTSVAQVALTAPGNVFANKVMVFPGNYNVGITWNHDGSAEAFRVQIVRQSDSFAVQTANIANGTTRSYNFNSIPLAAGWYTAKVIAFRGAEQTEGTYAFLV